MFVKWIGPTMNVQCDAVKHFAMAAWMLHGTCAGEECVGEEAAK